LHRQRLQALYQHNDDTPSYWNECRGTTPQQLLLWVHDAYEKGESAITLIDWVRQNRADCEQGQRIDVVMHYHRIKAEYRCEKMLMFCLLSKLYE
jgi:hypothetical protein